MSTRLSPGYYKNTDACADCVADVLIRVEGGVTRLTVIHDDTHLLHPLTNRATRATTKGN